MSGLRTSYLKTVVAAGAICGLASAACVAVALAPPEVHGASHAGPLLFVLLFLALLWLASSAALVVLGGVIALRRDAMEARGLPYHTDRPREWLPAPIFSVLRSAASSRGLRAGDWVQVRTLAEIASTLDQDGALGGLPFMPEMAGWCGRTAQVARRIDKLHDWIGKTGLRRVRSTVQLVDIRCDGSAHQGCQANCHIRWNESWLVRTTRPNIAAAKRTSAAAAVHYATEQYDRNRLVMHTRRGNRMRCQATELTAGTTPMSSGIYGRYFRDLLNGNVPPRAFLAGLSLAAFNRIQNLRSGVESPFYTPAAGHSTPELSLNLRPGEFVRVRTKAEIEATLNDASRNRGLRFDPDMLRYCGGIYRVRDRVELTMVEATGQLVHLSRPSIILEGVTATGEFRDFNPENEWIFWREIWLERFHPADTGA